MLIPKQTAGIDRYRHHGVSIPDALVSRDLILPAARVGGASTGFFGGQTLGFSCGPWGCVCTGDDDCNDMFSTNACGPWAVCIGNVCYCRR